MSIGPGRVAGGSACKGSYSLVWALKDPEWFERRREVVHAPCPDPAKVQR